MGKKFSKNKSKDNELNEDKGDNTPVPVTPENQNPYGNDSVVTDGLHNKREKFPAPPSDQNHYSNDPHPQTNQYPYPQTNQYHSRDPYPNPNQNQYTGDPRDPHPNPSQSPSHNIPGNNGGMDIYSEINLYTALYNYEKRSESEISISEGDHLEILDKEDDNWWLAINKSTQEEGYVPANYIAELDSLDSQPWFFGNVKRAEAIRFLMLPENDIGAFLVRESLSNNKSVEECPYSLSVRFGAEIKNYRIATEGDLWYITVFRNKMRFNSVQELIDHYKRNGDLCCHLGNPCVNPEMPVTAGLSHGDEWELDKSAVQLNKKIGSGQFGEVFDGIASNTRVAIKTLKPGTMKPESFLAEAILMKELRHKNLIQLYAVCTKDEPIYIITEFMINGDLLNYLRKGEGQHLKEDILVDMSSQIAAGMSFLEENKYIHRDLAARNVLVGENNIVKVADFGLSRLIEDDEYSPQAGAKFPVKWTAPEAITYCIFTIKSDVWSFGIVLFEIISRGKMPYPGSTNREVMTMLESGYRMPKDPECPQQFYDIMLKCWNAEPQSRPTFLSLTWEFDEYHNLPDYQTEDKISEMEKQRRFR